MLSILSCKGCGIVDSAATVDVAAALLLPLSEIDIVFPLKCARIVRCIENEEHLILSYSMAATHNSNMQKQAKPS